MSEMLDKLRLPFHPSMVNWKPGAVKGDRALAMAYADLRAYMHRLDEVCGDAWEVNYEPWGQDRIICRLTINGVTRSSTGESDKDSEKSEIGGTSAEAQAFKRASAMFGLGRYLYNLPTGWAEYDPARRQFTEKAKAKLMGILVQHYRRATEAKGELPEIYATDDDGVPATDGNHAQPRPEGTRLLAQFNALGHDLYGDQWQQVSRRNAKRISGGKTQEGSELMPEQIQQLIDGMTKLKSKRQATDVDFGMGEPQNAPQPSQKPVDASEGTPPHQRMWGQGASAFGPDWDMARAWLIRNWTEKVAKSAVRESAADLNDDEKDMLADYIKSNLKKLQASWTSHKAALLQSTGETANGVAGK